MKNTVHYLFLITIFLSSCSSTKITNSWREPGAHLYSGEWNKILVVALLKNETNRRKVEDELLLYLNGKGIVSYNYLNEDFNKIDEDKFDSNGEEFVELILYLLLAFAVISFILSKIYCNCFSL
jgi:hypothetical protein